MTDEQEPAESLDDDVLDADPDPDLGPPDDVPAEDYPPAQPIGIDDPNVLEIPDDVSTRTLREQPEEMLGEPGEEIGTEPL